jgi:hypothetical protein
MDMENRGLIFIPDISGFTRFINDIEIEHGRLIIQELLEAIVSSNKIGLEISEIEGDAILFYRFGKSPELTEIYKQVEMMFCEFHKRLIEYDLRKFCQCGACITAIDLSLKVITHYGEFTGYSVRNFNKLIGKDIIVAHQLLKNDIKQHEYWLVTASLSGNNLPGDTAGWMKWQESKKQIENGEIAFHYAQLSPLKETIKVEPFAKPDLAAFDRILNVTKEFEIDIITLLHLTGSFEHKNKWMEGVNSVKLFESTLPRIGMRALFLKDEGEEIFYSSSYSFSPEKVEFTENNEADTKILSYTLKRTGENSSVLVLEVYVKNDIARSVKNDEAKMKETEEMYDKSFKNLEHLTKNLPENV